MKKGKPYTKMTLHELRQATRQFDKEIPLSETRPLSSKKQREFHQMQQQTLRHAKLQGRKTVVLNLDQDLLARSDQYAQKHGMSRSELIERSLRSALVFTES